jgi:hypothetical protein
MSSLRLNFKDDEQWGVVPGLDSSFDDYGDYKHHVVVQHLEYFHRQDGDLLDDVLDQCVLYAQTSQILHKPVFYDAHETEIAIPEGIPLKPTPSGPTVVSKREPDYDQLRPFFGWISPEIIKKTFQHTTQYARLPAGTSISLLIRLLMYFAVRKMLLVTLSTLTSQPSMMVPLLLSLLALTPKSLMSMALRRTNSLSTHWKITSSNVVPP